MSVFDELNASNNEAAINAQAKNVDQTPVKISTLASLKQKANELKKDEKQKPRQYGNQNYNMENTDEKPSQKGTSNHHSFI